MTTFIGDRRWIVKVSIESGINITEIYDFTRIKEIVNEKVCIDKDARGIAHRYIIPYVLYKHRRSKIKSINVKEV